jgi:hypothetical protein
MDVRDARRRAQPFLEIEITDAAKDGRKFHERQWGEVSARRASDRRRATTARSGVPG